MAAASAGELGSPVHLPGGSWFEGSHLKAVI
jgi:hypothetical protein